MNAVAGLQIRELTPADAVAGAALARSRGWSYEPERWGYSLTVGRGWGAVGPGGELVGTVTLTACTDQVVAVGSMLVAEPLAGLGLGRRLLALALDAAGDRIVALFATRSGRPLYERLGFRPVGRLGMYRGVFTPVRAGPAPAGAGGARTRATTPADLPAVVALDALAHGGDRSQLLAPLLGLALGSRVCLDARGEVCAFAAAWPSERGPVVGPVLARDGAAAVAVLSALAGDLPGPVRVDVRADRPELRPWLAGHGFQAFAHTTAMLRGPRDLPGRSELVHAPIMQSLT